MDDREDYMEALRESKSRRLQFPEYSNRDLTDVEQLASLESISDYDKNHRNARVSTGGTLGTFRRTAILKQKHSANRVRESLDLHESDDGSCCSESDGSHGGAIPFYARPVQRQRWGEDQVLPHVNWGDIFFDLFYVAAAYNLGSMLISSLDTDNAFRGVVYFVGIFGPLYFMWESKLVYEARYSVVDMAHRLLEVVRVFFISFAVLHIKTIDLMSDPSSAETLCFTVSLFLESLIPILLKTELILYGEGDREAIRNHSTRKIKNIFIPVSTLYLAAAIIAVVQYVDDNDDNKAADNDYASKPAEDKDSTYGSSYSSEKDDEHVRLLAAATDDYGNSNDSGWKFADLPIALCCIAYVFNLVYTYIRKKKLLSKNEDFRISNVPTNIDFQIHRYGEWVLLMLGESVLSLLIVETTESSDYYVVAVVGILTIIVLQALHFESEPSHADAHALWRNITSQLVYSYLIQVLSMGLIAFGASYKVMLKLIHKESIKSDAYDDKSRNLAGDVEVTDTAVAGVFCASLALVVLTLEVMTWTHKGAKEFKKRLFGIGVTEKSKKRIPIIFMSILKVGLLLVTVTLPLWVTRATTLSVIAFFVVGGVALMRVIGWNIYHKKHEVLGSSCYVSDVIEKHHTNNGKSSENTSNEMETGNDNHRSDG